LAKLDEPVLKRALQTGATNAERAEVVSHVERDARSVKTAPRDIDAGVLANNCGESALPRDNPR
jgi:hypothetical protein